VSEPTCASATRASEAMIAARSRCACLSTIAMVSWDLVNSV
jgi:hypothetical protein